MTPIAPSIGWVPSPHYGRGRGRYRPTATIIHYTAGNGAIPWFASPRSCVSAHFVIQRDGVCTQMVDTDDTAWHCGVASALYDGRSNANVNKFSVGIELENFGRLRRQGRGFVAWDTQAPAAPISPPVLIHGAAFAEGWWEPFPTAQIEGLDRLLSVMDAHGLADAAHNLLGHIEIAPGRKVDPGPLFPWTRYCARRQNPLIITG